MQTQIMNRIEKGFGDSLQTHLEGLSNNLNFSQSRSASNSSYLLRCDKETITDQNICNCACETIPKLKQKAHKSFMQVIQIQNLYKEQIQDLKKFYEESIKNKDKKFKIKEDIFIDRCKQMEAQIQKLKQQNKKYKPSQVQLPFQLSFDLENNSPNPIPDQSNESIYNIREFIQTPNLKDNTKKLHKSIIDLIFELRKFKGSHDRIDNRTDSITILEEHVIKKVEVQIDKIFAFIDTIIQNTVQAHEKYNQLVLFSQEAENRYSKIHGLQEANQKQLKFMTEHIKKISQDRIKLQRKNSGLQKTIKSQQQTIKFLKKMLNQQQKLKHNQSVKKDIECMSSHNLRSEDGQISEVNSMLSNKIQRKNNAFNTKLLQNPNEKLLPKSLIFKKKIQIKEKSPQKQF